jgi:hypothetical protein
MKRFGVRCFRFYPVTNGDIVRNFGGLRFHIFKWGNAQGNSRMIGWREARVEALRPF